MSELDRILGDVRVVDLTQTLDTGTSLWPGSTPMQISVAGTYERDGGFWREFAIPEHAGTHVDAPAHFVPNAPTVDLIDVATLVRPAVKLDVRGWVADDPDAAVTADVLRELEDRDGVIEGGAAVLIHTGWDRFVREPGRYLGTDEVPRSPGLSGGAAALLVERRVAGIGIDTLSVDVGSSTVLPVHHATLPAGLWHIEGLVGLAAVPARGAWVVVAPLRLGGGSGAPARVLALVPS